MQVDLLIVGQGLAGSVLACEAWSRGLTVAVIDRGTKQSASMVAAGMWNPVSFRRILEVWRAPEFMGAMLQKYPAWCASIGVRAFFPKPVLRVFPNQAYADLWQKRLAEGMPWIESAEDLPADIHAPFGAGRVPKAGYVHLPRFLSAVRDRLAAEACLLEADFDPEQLENQVGGVRYAEFEADHAIIACGVWGRTLPWFKELPLRTNKGEVLDVSAQLSKDQILNNGKWILPFEGGSFKLGASYDWQHEDLQQTPAIREELLAKVTPMIGSAPEVLEHRVGLRPVVKDRRPLLGRLEKRLWSFNGLGTRGVLIAPLLAAELIDHIDLKRPLHPETDLERFR